MHRACRFVFLHDRVLCPCFGWTTGYHDYRASSVNHVASTMILNHGYHGTLRSGDTVPTTPDSKVGVADLFHEPGHC